MSALVKPSWISYALSGALALVASWALTGCYFGNRTVNQQAASDGVSGYYETAPQSLQFCATTCQNVATNQIPTDYSSIMTNPVGLQLQNASTGDAILFPYTGGQYGIAVTASTNGTVTTNQSSSPVQLWDDPACTSEQDEVIEGQFKISGGPFTSSPPGIPISGHLALTITYTTTFSGNCTASLTSMADCYADSTQCGSHNQSDVQALFEPYINAGALTAAGIVNLSTLAFEISYQ
jgi:hypothetical protein